MGERTLSVDVGDVSGRWGCLSFTVKREGAAVRVYLLASDPHDMRRSGQGVLLEEDGWTELKALVRETDKAIEEVRSMSLKPSSATAPEPPSEPEFAVPPPAPAAPLAPVMRTTEEHHAGRFWIVVGAVVAVMLIAILVAWAALSRSPAPFDPRPSTAPAFSPAPSPPPPPPAKADDDDE